MLPNYRLQKKTALRGSFFFCEAATRIKMFAN